MRAWFTDATGKTADLCLFLNRHNTRLIIRDKVGAVIFHHVFPSWLDAVDALKSMGGRWTSDMTSHVLE